MEEEAPVKLPHGQPDHVSVVKWMNVPKLSVNSCEELRNVLGFLMTHTRDRNQDLMRREGLRSSEA
eukprot:scaffold64477_cov52-Attheya_sp.AAC.1